MVNTETDAFVFFASTMIRCMNGNAFSACYLEIERQEGAIGFSTCYKTPQGAEGYYEIENGAEVCEVIRDLYAITQTQPPIHKDWNKALFTLYPDGKSDMEYIWDAEMQAEIDKYNEEARKRRERRKKS
jgi:hypothetical protein